MPNKFTIKPTQAMDIQSTIIIFTSKAIFFFFFKCFVNNCNSILIFIIRYQQHQFSIIFVAQSTHDFDLSFPIFVKLLNDH